MTKGVIGLVSGTWNFHVLACVHTSSTFLYSIFGVLCFSIGVKVELREVVD